MGELECNNLDLQDQIQILEQKLSYSNKQPCKLPAVAEEEEESSGGGRGEGRSSEVCEETLHAKDQYIAKLEQETLAVNAEIKKLVSFTIRTAVSLMFGVTSIYKVT